MSYLIKSPYDNEWSTVNNFGHTDNEQLFKKNLKDFGSNWYWSDKPFTYKYNSYGYRMDKELSDVDFDNYFAFFGCSFCTGVGLPLEETYAYKISQKAGVDYVNAGIGGGSVDLVHINFVEMFSKSPKLPKAVMINWPELSRSCFWHDDRLEFYMANKDDPMLYWNELYQAFAVEESHLDNRFKTIRKSISKMCELANVKLFEMTTHQADMQFHSKHEGIIEVQKSPGFNSNDVAYFNSALARDVVFKKPTSLAHPGIYFQDKVVEKFFEETI